RQPAQELPGGVRRPHHERGRPGGAGADRRAARHPRRAGLHGRAPPPEAVRLVLQQERLRHRPRRAVRQRHPRLAALAGRPGTAGHDGPVSLYRLSVGLFLLCGFLLLTFGCAVVAAPVTLPLTYLAVRRHPSRPFRWVAGVLAGLTTVEVAWAVVYVLD